MDNLKINLLLTISVNNGISYNNYNLSNKNLISIFQKNIKDKILIVGKNTLNKLTNIKDSIIYCLTNHINNSKPNMLENNNNVFYYSNLNDILDNISYSFPNKEILVIGGGKLYNYILENENMEKRIEKIYLTVLKNEFACDIFININYDEYIITNREEDSEYEQYILSRLKIN
jgi:dihydrofolate reductase